MGKNSMAGSNMSPETRREIVKWIVQSALGVMGYGIILFLVAGTLNWVWGWVLLAVLALLFPAIYISG